MYKRVYMNKQATEIVITRHNDSGDLTSYRIYKLRDAAALRFFDAVRDFVPLPHQWGPVYDSRMMRKGR